MWKTVSNPDTGVLCGGHTWHLSSSPSPLPLPHTNTDTASGFMQEVGVNVMPFQMSLGQKKF